MIKNNLKLTSRRINTLILQEFNIENDLLVNGNEEDRTYLEHELNKDKA